MPLTGKRILITGGAGFIGTTLATRLVDDNEVVAVDNLHRDALSGTDLADHPTFHFAAGDVLDPATPPAPPPHGTAPHPPPPSTSRRATASPSTGSPSSQPAARTSSTRRASPASTPCSRA